MPIEVLGNEVSIMHIGRRQLKLRGPRKANKRLVVFKRKSVPSETKYSLQARICLSEAAMSARGGTLEDVVGAVINRCSGKKYKPESVIRAEKEAKYRQHEANLARMKEKLSGVGASVGTERRIPVRPPARL